VDLPIRAPSALPPQHGRRIWIWIRTPTWAAGNGLRKGAGSRGIGRWKIVVSAGSRWTGRPGAVARPAGLATRGRERRIRHSRARRGPRR
jgi:hypothetical protein